MKKLLAAFCLLCLLLCAAVFSAEAASDALSFELLKDGSGYTVSGCSPEAKVVIIPATHEGLPVKAIADRAFTDCRELKMFLADKKSEYFYAEDGVLFTDIPVKTLVRFPNHPKEYETYAYRVPEGTEVIAPWAFSGCINLEYLHIPEGVTTLGDYAFAYAEPPINMAVYAPASLKKIGKNILQNATGNVPFYAPKGAAILKYCRSKKIPCEQYQMPDPLPRTVPTAAPDLMDAEDPEPPDPAKRIEKTYIESVDFMGLNMYSRIDLSGLQEGKPSEILVRADQRWPSLLPDAEGKTANGSAPWEGLYGIGWTEGETILRGYDRDGKVTGIRKVDGDFVFALPGAVTLGVSGGSGTRLNMVPYEPLILTGPGDLPLSADMFRTGKDGKPFTLIVQAFPYSNREMIMPEHLNILSFSEQDPFAPLEGASDHYILSLYEAGTPYLMDQIGQITLRFHQMETIYEGDGMSFMVSPAITGWDKTLPEDVHDLFLAEKEFMEGVFYPAGTELYPVVYVLNGGYPCAYTLNRPVAYVILDSSCVSVKKEGYIYTHETVHAIDYSIPHMDELAPPAWWEGRAEYICLKVCKQLKLKNNNTYPARCNWSFLTPEDKADFYRYFYESTNRETAYPVGYYFVKYLCDTYGEEVLGKIMENISNAQPRTGREMEIFKECVTSVTDPDVFQNFVRDVVR